MKTLILLRHAKSSWKDLTLADFDRPLNKRGKRDAPFMAEKLAEHLKSHNLNIDRVLTSPAKRTRKTIKAFINALALSKSSIVENRAIYLATREEMVEMIKNIPDDLDTLVVCGHNPGLTELNQWLGGRDVDDGVIENIPTCGISILSLDVNRWGETKKACASSLAYLYPKQYSS